MSGPDPNVPGRNWISLVNRCREDAEFRERLAADPAAALAGAGLQSELPAGVDRVSVVENTADTFHVIFPPNPNALLGDAALDAVAGGGPGACHSERMLSYFRRYNGCHWELN